MAQADGSMEMNAQYIGQHILGSGVMAFHLQVLRDEMALPMVVNQISDSSRYQ